MKNEETNKSSEWLHYSLQKKEMILIGKVSFSQNFIGQHLKLKGNIMDDSLDNNDNGGNEGTFQEAASFQNIIGNLDETTTSTEENTAVARTSTPILSIVVDKASKVSLSKNRWGKRKLSPADLVALLITDFLNHELDKHEMLQELYPRSGKSFKKTSVGVQAPSISAAPFIHR